MLNQLERHPLASSSCGVPLIAELIHASTHDPQLQQLEQTLIWAGLLHCLEELERVLYLMEPPIDLATNQAVALYAAIHLGGNLTQANPPLYRLFTEAVPNGIEHSIAGPWMMSKQVLEWAESSSWFDVIRQASLLHLSNPARLFDDFLAQLDTFIVARMPFEALLRVSILFRNQEKLPAGWQSRLADAINEYVDLVDVIPLYRFWMVVFQVAPNWDFACVRAADLALRFEDFAIAEQILNSMQPANVYNPWFYDVWARCRYAYGDLTAAARYWSAALLKSSEDMPVFQVLRDRMLLALRGKYGLGEVIRLARAGDRNSALQLLKIVILYDPSFSNYYVLLESLENVPREDLANPLDHAILLQRVERLTNQFGCLWQSCEEQPAMCSADDPGHLLTFLRKATLLLDSCEESAF